jgi:DNA replication protein DnaC
MQENTGSQSRSPTVFGSHNIILFPFPFIHNKLLTDRFYFDSPQLSFGYMGRVAFSDIWSAVHTFKVEEGFSDLHIHGTMGYGKSHILTVLAGLLSRLGKRTVYLPDCRWLLGDITR